MDSLDVIGFAGQIGRLDFVTAVLASITVLIALGAIPTFFFLRAAARSVAKDEVEKRLVNIEVEVERQAIQRMESMLPTLVKEYVDLAERSAEANEADEIANAQDDED